MSSSTQQSAVSGQPEMLFRCFHCFETFDAQKAVHHFGEQRDALPACLVNSHKLVALIKVAVQITMQMATEDDLDTTDPDYDPQHPILADEVAGAIRGLSDCSDEGPCPEWKAFFEVEA